MSNNNNATWVTINSQSNLLPNGRSGSGTASLTTNTAGSSEQLTGIADLTRTD